MDKKLKMYYLIGNKDEFAVEIEITEDSKNLWKNKTCLWFENVRVGDWEDENYIAPFILSLFNIVTFYEKYWEPEFENLTCKDIFLLSHPFYNIPDAFYDISYQEQALFIKYDKYLFQWGENFDNWSLTFAYSQGVGKFIWVHTPLGERDSYDVRNNIQCSEIHISIIQDAFKKLKEVIPSEFWPNNFPN